MLLDIYQAHAAVVYFISHMRWQVDVKDNRSNIFVTIDKMDLILGFVLVYCIYGLVALFYDNIPESYVMLSLYLSFKWIFNYRKCTLSYYEVKLRGVRKEDGYLYQFLEKLVNFRNNELIIPVIVFQLIVILYYFRNKFLKAEAE